VTPTDFRWIEWNIESATKHGCTIREIESLVLNPPRGCPRKFASQSGKQSWLVQGGGQGNRLIEVLYSMDVDGKTAKTAFVFHAMPLRTRKRRSRR
jgi:hypothetical protein